MKATIRGVVLLFSAICLVAATIPAIAFTQQEDFPFSDVDDTQWYYEAVCYAYENELMNGTSSTSFSPDEITSRGMVVTLLHRLEGEPAADTLLFEDVVAGAYYEQAVAWATENRIVDGYGNGKFGPDDTITREQLAVILYCL